MVCVYQNCVGQRREVEISDGTPPNRIIFRPRGDGEWLPRVVAEFHPAYQTTTLTDNYRFITEKQA